MNSVILIGFNEETGEFFFVSDSDLGRIVTFVEIYSPSRSDELWLIRIITRGEQVPKECHVLGECLVQVLEEKLAGLVRVAGFFFNQNSEL